MIEQDNRFALETLRHATLPMVLINFDTQFHVTHWSETDQMQSDWCLAQIMANRLFTMPFLRKTAVNYQKNTAWNFVLNQNQTFISSIYHNIFKLHMLCVLWNSLALAFGHKCKQTRQVYSENEYRVRRCSQSGRICTMIYSYFSYFYGLRRNNVLLITQNRAQTACSIIYNMRWRQYESTFSEKLCRELIEVVGRLQLCERVPYEQCIKKLPVEPFLYIYRHWGASFNP